MGVQETSGTTHHPTTTETHPTTCSVSVSACACGHLKVGSRRSLREGLLNQAGEVRQLPLHVLDAEPGGVVGRHGGRRWERRPGRGAGTAWRQLHPVQRVGLVQEFCVAANVKKWSKGWSVGVDGNNYFVM